MFIKGKQLFVILTFKLYKIEWKKIGFATKSWKTFLAKEIVNNISQGVKYKIRLKYIQ